MGVKIDTNLDPNLFYVQGKKIYVASFFIDSNLFSSVLARLVKGDVTSQKGLHYVDKKLNARLNYSV